MLYFVQRVFFSKTDMKQSHSCESFYQGTDEQNKKDARARWHNICAADINKETIQYELVQVVREDGIVIESEIIGAMPKEAANE